MEAFEEMKDLARAIGYDVVGEVLQKRHSIHPAHFVGRGKLEEVSRLAAETGATTLLVDAELNPRQVRNLERETGLSIEDRSEIVLNIFARRARTSQAKLQVELARLQYTLPRLRRMWTHLSRTEGRVGVRAGSGEKQLEEDLRVIRRKIFDLKRSLREIEERKQREVANRTEDFTVSLVGYTNAGKSTLMNVLTGAGTLVEDKVFATLDTMTRVWELPSKRKVLLSDTVGFLRRLPHHLIRSFHATLEETRKADLLLHVVDASNPGASSQISAVRDVLEEIGAADKPTIVVLNKIDRIGSRLDFQLLKNEVESPVSLSAMTGEGIDELRRRVMEKLDEVREEFEITVPVRDGRILSMVSRVGIVLERENLEDAVRLRLRLTPANSGRLSKTLQSEGLMLRRIV